MAQKFIDIVVSGLCSVCVCVLCWIPLLLFWRGKWPPQTNVAVHHRFVGADAVVDTTAAVGAHCATRSYTRKSYNTVYY